MSSLLFKEVIRYMMRTLIGKKLNPKERIGPLCPWKQSRLEKEKTAINKWTPYWSGDTPSKGIRLRTIT